MIAMLFTVLLMSVVLGFVMFKLSQTATVTDLNRVIDDVNALGETVTGAIGKTVEELVANKTSNDVLRGLYDELLVQSSANTNDISNNSTSNVILQSAVNKSVGDIHDITQSLAIYVTPAYLTANNYAVSETGNPYIKTNALDEAVEGVGYLKMDAIEERGFDTLILRESGQIEATIRAADNSVVSQPYTAMPNQVRIEPTGISFHNTVSDNRGKIMVDGTQL
jgi:hypothetical protein